jgi:ATP-dependent helicase HepA
METEFSIGQLVCLKVDTARQGPVIEVMSAVAGRNRYRVFHSPSEIREYYQEQLVLAAQMSRGASGPIGFAQDRLQSPEEFCARLTALRLANPLTDNLYALHAARIQFIPFQFKPLLRLLRSDRPRLLVADEVGVGKTIEAGLMLKELQSRQRLENVIIVCPKALVTKWRAEMHRFDEDFHPLKAETLRYCLSVLAVHNTRLVELKLASLDAYHRNRLARIQAELANAREERIRRMKTAELARAERDHTARPGEIEHRRQADIIRECVAFGLLEILHGD